MVVVEFTEEEARALADCGLVGAEGCPDAFVAEAAHDALEKLEAARAAAGD